MMIICLQCNNEFVPTLGSRKIFCSLTCYGVYNGKIKSQKTQEAYYLNPKLCKHCNKVIDYAKRKNNIFCNSKCAATFNNSKKLKQQQTKRKTYYKKQNNDIWGEYTRIFLCTCKFSGIKWYSPKIKTISPLYNETMKNYAYQCRFTFNIRKYKEWFNYSCDLIKEYGWYSPANKRNNLYGCSRDHIYSISDGFKNKIDPKVISHPANCRIVPHNENQKKHKKSDITIDELYERIKKFDEKYKN